MTDRETRSLLADLGQAVGSDNLLTDPTGTARYREGYRFGGGGAIAVVRPAMLVQMWRAARAAIDHGAIVIVQAANTGLTGGSTPYGEYDRPVVIVSTSRIGSVIALDGGKEAICLAGSTLTSLEHTIDRFDRIPHSVIGSSCIGASVVGGICNNSGGSLVRRGPAFTRQSLFARVTEKGVLELVNHLGRDLGETEEEILGHLDRGDSGTETPQIGSDMPIRSYLDRLRSAGDTPARYNSDPELLLEASGSAGKLIVFAVRVPTFAAPREEASFLIGSNSTDDLARLRRAMLDTLDPLPSSCEYLHRSASDLAAKYGRDICQMLRLFGAGAMPRLLAVQKGIDTLGRRARMGHHLAARLSQSLFALAPAPVPRSLRALLERFEHVLIAKTDDTGIAPLADLLDKFGRDTGIAVLRPSADEAQAAMRLRFASAGASVRVSELGGGTAPVAALDIALPAGALDWWLDLPPDLDALVQARAIYGHFLCNVFHLDYVLKAGTDRADFEARVKRLVEQRGGRMPAEHSFGHMYEVPRHVVDFYRALDPTNSLNPGIGKTSRRKDWAA